MSTNRLVLDSFALLAFVQQERGWERVRDLLQRAVGGEVELHMSAINLAEVQYMALRRQKDTSQALAALQALPITVASADEYLPAVVELKAQYAVSLADCFAAALAVSLDCPVVTGDPEFRKMEDVVSVEWL